jgi:hypothetical protein
MLTCRYWGLPLRIFPCSSYEPFTQANPAPCTKSFACCSGGVGWVAWGAAAAPAVDTDFIGIYSSRGKRLQSDHCIDTCLLSRTESARCSACAESARCSAATRRSAGDLCTEAVFSIAKNDCFTVKIVKQSSMGRKGKVVTKSRHMRKFMECIKCLRSSEFLANRTWLQLGPRSPDGIPLKTVFQKQFFGHWDSSSKRLKKCRKV